MIVAIPEYISAERTTALSRRDLSPRYWPRRSEPSLAIPSLWARLLLVFLYMPLPNRLRPREAEVQGFSAGRARGAPTHTSASQKSFLLLLAISYRSDLGKLRAEPGGQAKQIAPGERVIAMPTKLLFFLPFPTASRCREAEGYYVWYGVVTSAPPAEGEAQGARGRRVSMA